MIDEHYNVIYLVIYDILVQILLIIHTVSLTK